MSDDPVATMKESAVLRLLIRGREMFGLEMVTESETLPSAQRLKRGTVYVTLSRMEDKGFLTSKKAQALPGERGLPKRRYRITALGERALAAWELSLGQLVGGSA